MRIIKFFFISLLLAGISFPQPSNKSLYEIRTFGFGVHGGLSQVNSYLYDDIFNYNTEIFINIMLPIRTDKVNFGTTASVQFGSLYDRTGKFTYELKKKKFLSIKGGLQYLVHFSSVVSLSLQLTAGKITYKASGGNSDNRELSTFLLTPAAGFKFWLANNFSIDLMSSYNKMSDRFTTFSTPGMNNFISTNIGFNYFFTKVIDDDKDGVYDEFDKCPSTREGEPVDEFGCAKYQKDADGDGIDDKADKCPNTSQKEITLINSSGCGPSERDTDGDGINDFLDKSINTPPEEIKLVDVFGCGPSERDSDHDGVNDRDDKCLLTPIGEKVNKYGCSIYDLDKDHDGVLDSTDICIGDAENFNFYKDGDGCSDSIDYEKPVYLNKFKSLFKDSLSGTLSYIGENIIKAQAIPLYQDYSEVYWIIEVESPDNAEEKSIQVKKYIDYLIQRDCTATEFRKGDKEKVLLKINKARAKDIYLNSVNHKLL